MAARVLGRLEDLLTGIYDLDTGCRVEDFLVTDRAQLPGGCRDAPDDRQRFRMLQRLGDVALFVAGFLAGSFSRGPVDIDYHIAMGGRAYGTLAHAPYHGAQRVLGYVFAELQDKFQPLVDALSEIGEGAAQNSPRDVLRLYELWHKTGSQRAHRLLLKLGIRPVAAGAFAN